MKPRPSIADLAGLIALRFDSDMRLVERTRASCRLTGLVDPGSGRGLTELEASGALYPGVAADARSVAEGREELTREVELAGGHPFTARIVRDPGPDGQGVLVVLEPRSPGADREQHRLARIGEMAAIVAHEVKNPLAGIGGALQVICDRMVADAPEREIIGEILARLAGLNELVDGLVRHARPLKPRLSEVSLAELVGRATGALGGRERAGVEVVGDGRVQADGDLLVELFTRVLDNAARANRRERGPVRVEIEGAGAAFTITISDHGPGIQRELHERIFEPFFTTRNQGIGLGLAEARRIARAHGGDLVMARSSPGGAAFALHLPTRGP